MKSFGENPVSFLTSRLWALTTKGLALLSVLRRSLDRRLRTDPLYRSDREGGLIGHAQGGGCCPFAGAQTFQDLFQRLDAKRVLWGSQRGSAV